MAEQLTTAQFGRLYSDFMTTMLQQAGDAAQPLLERLKAHLGVAPDTLAVHSEEFDAFEHANVQVALDALTEQPGRTAELIGIGVENKRFMSLTLSDLVGRGGMFGRPLAEGPVDYVNVHLADERVLACVQCGLYLLSEGDERLVVLVVGATEGGGRQRLRVDVLANTLEAGPRFLKELLAMMQERNVFRQQVISISPGQLGPGPQKLVAFHHLPPVQRDEVILPPALLERIERSTLVFSQHAQQLAAANRSLKRGLLLYGPPGVGKTLTVLYLISHLPGRTTILASGLGLGLLQVIMQLARTLAPATVVLEDVDLIAQERGQSFMGGGNPLLFELLNELDGLREDTDVIFLLTTNRPEILEPALAARPGRIDQVIEFPLPDAADRRRLIDLYAQGLDLAQIDVAALVEQTAGASPAYIKELLRKVAVLAVADTGTLLIQPQHLVTALEEIAQGGLLAQRLLGAQQSPSGPPGMAFSQQMPGFPGAPFHQVG